MSIEFHVSAELRPWPAKKELAACLQAAGLQISVGIYSIRIKGSSFIFQEYGGDLGDPMLVSDALNLTEMINDASWL